MFRLLRYRSSSISSAALTLAVFTVVGSGLSIVRNSLLAAKFGATHELDIYYAAFRIPDFIYNIFYLGIVSVLFLPVFNDLYARDHEKAWKFFEAITSWIIMLFGIGAVIVFIFAPVLVPLLVPGFSPDAIATVIVLTRLMLIQPIILGISNHISGVLQSFNRFAATSVAHICYNLGVVSGIVFLVPLFGLRGLAGGVVLGAILHLCIQLPSFFDIKKKFHFSLKPESDIVRPYLKLLPMRIFNVAANQINVLAVTILASMAPAGSLAVFSFANDLQTLPQTVIAVSLAVAAFPTLSRLARNKRESFYSMFDATLRQTLAWLVPTAMFMIVFRAHIVRLLLGYGKFDWSATVATLQTLLIFALGLALQGLLPLLTRAYFAMQNTRIPFFGAVAGNIITIGLGTTLLPHYGVRGLAIALASANAVNAGILYIVLLVKMRRSPWSLLKDVVILAALSFVGAGLGWVCLQLVNNLVDTHTVIGLAIQAVVSGSIGVGAFLLLLKLFNRAELDHFVSFFKKPKTLESSPIALE